MEINKNKVAVGMAVMITLVVIVVCIVCLAFKLF